MTKALIYILSVLLSVPGYGAITLNSDLNFGKIIVASPHQIGSVTVSPTGATSSSGSIHVIQKGHPAELLLEDFPVGVYLNVTTYLLNDQLNHTSQSTAGHLGITALHHVDRVYTDRFGRARLVIGGTMQSQPLAHAYLDGNYQTTVSLEISY
ncbi:DUF4402 domain-containing protein [Pseudoalteromonas rubra]|uniref:DUF4402 domain-containing protein n=1 Tax=Pseudoalteromonas rubra TaxID=43658 RepID=A0A0F4QYJ9_9GAMM|nr:DUF4402 domain-containing protein [Pseudoalteromonas rubra]KJZ12340.1 hypothetical protein TW77_02965 [Pseudoalteromonas rubra]